VQICDTGILPGSASGKLSGEISGETIGVPVICLGVPTVISGEALNVNLDSTFFTLSDVDIQMNDLAQVIANGITDFLSEAR
jgi:spore protease